MSIMSKLDIESRGMLATFVFYVAVGIIFIVLLPFANFPPHVGIMGIFSLIAAYGLVRKRSWTIWIVVILFFVGTTFSVYMLNYFLVIDYLLGAGTMAYLILTWIATAYVAAKRRTLEK